ncbi:GPP34 family phosphoprotein [Henriciella barbarensis]|uniref:GPP34 family phosphoprotein n=1 Tax=Henriciella barbarensis TaxID=86342 RepID=A0A399R909_9PROT|nr:GPP34 family phosphoprotein [Henriciella barbarensis]RIJ25999.1 GPP34 family phosphoprotein [Henriciella barbarensis]
MTLTIAEGLVLLSLKNETGEKSGQFVEYGLAGSAIAELILRERVALDTAKKKKLSVTDVSPTGDVFLDFCLETLAKRGDGRSVKSAVSKLANKSKLFSKQAQALVDKGMLRADPQSFLFFNWTRYPEAAPEAEASLVRHLGAVMFEDQSPEAEDCVIIALGDKTGLLKKNFPKEMLKAHKGRIREISKGGMASTKATIQAIEAVQVALMASIAAASASSASVN